MITLILIPGSEMLSRKSAMHALATNRAAEANPGVWSFSIRSLSTVFGTWKQRSSYPFWLLSSLTMRQVSDESFPPM